MRNKDFLTKSLIAHRGIHYRYKENTIPSFKTALKRGYPIELDIQLTKDKKIIVYHDNNLLRLTGINKEISNSTYNELKSITNIPTLEEVLELVKGKVPLIIEYKFSNNHELEKYSIKYLDNYIGEFSIQSFNILTILWFKKNRKKYIRGLIVNSIFSKNIFINLLLNEIFLKYLLNPDYIVTNKNYLNNEKIKRLRKKYLIIGYTINNNKEYLKYKQLADNFICNMGKEPYGVRFLDR